MIDLSGRVAFITGAGGGLGRAHAILLASRGAKIVVNEVEQAAGSAERVVEEIRALGAEATLGIGSVTDQNAIEDVAASILQRWGRIDILVNNAGILRDRSFAKMSIDEMRAVLDVHVMGAFVCTKAVWEPMKERKFGRIVMTTSSSGLFGNFGQANYAAAKMALVGLMQALAIEGMKDNIRVNCLAPTGATKMLEGLMPAEALAKLRPDVVSPAVVALVADNAPTRAIVCTGASVFASAHITLSEGVYISPDGNVAEKVQARWAEITDRTNDRVPSSGADQWRKELDMSQLIS
jgi:NAD(P)-dependent dehydrogenase (short-subunit alcohol dehydrogenase family)